MNHLYKTYGELITKADEINDLYSKEEILDVFEEIRMRLQDARNELCEVCGRYAEAHKGACDKCYWRE